MRCVHQGERVADLILNHARANECQDVPRFKQEMAQLVDQALSNTLSLGKVPGARRQTSTLEYVLSSVVELHVLI